MHKKVPFVLIMPYKSLLVLMEHCQRFKINTPIILAIPILY